jgi:hypothetical protein
MPLYAAIRLAIRALNNPATKAFAKRILQSANTGNVAQATKQASMLSKAMKSGIFKISDATVKTKNLSKAVSMRKQGLYYNPQNQTAGTGYFTQFNKTPMIDIDVAKGGSHYAKNVVFQNKDAALTNLSKYLKTPEGKKSLFATYDTPGGIRLFDLSRRRTPKAYYNPTGNVGGKESGWLNLKLGGDHAYPAMNLSRNKFSARISPKPGREGDKVAKLIDYMGDGSAIPKNLGEVRKYHDALINKVIKSSTKDNISIGGLFSKIGS